MNGGLGYRWISLFLINSHCMNDDTNEMMDTIIEASQYTAAPQGTEDGSMEIMASARSNSGSFQRFGL